MVLKANFVDLVISDLVLKPKLVLILTVLTVKFDLADPVLDVKMANLIFITLIRVNVNYINYCRIFIVILGLIGGCFVCGCYVRVHHV